MENNDVKQTEKQTEYLTENTEKRLDEATEKDFELLKECLKESETAGLNVSLKQLGFMGFTDINDVTTVSVRNTIGITDKFIKLIVTFKDRRDFDITQIKGMYNQFIRENTKEVLEKHKESLLFTVELGKANEKQNLYYSIKLYNPLICLSEDDKALHFVFAMDNMTFGKFNVSYEDMLNELEYENQ